ncbi:MAG: hypothetical protein RL702_1972 [Pseudomonadota bacterium]|jgi:hypothetical protein|nr:hypothetical protein [Novosphingobium sp.]HOA48377.1 hypothetical protein [Novosphingobium sp.]HPB22129.1 hypothetical protein [Novosphingobium sp.]HPZ47006.1 hypothetical protein [Novosphingobium sp.]HQD99747.1 hypothetical protein [Novosphingobium sp.]
MASKPPQSSRVVDTPQFFVPPSVRELRAQAVQRLQAGLFGLAAIVLIVGLANIINDRARLADAEAGKPAAAVTKDGAAQNDPLAEIGIVPATRPDAAASSTSSASPRGR